MWLIIIASFLLTDVAASPGQARLELSLSTPAIKQGQNVFAVITLRNVGKGALWVRSNPRFGTNVDDEDMREWRLSIRDPNGRPVGYDCLARKLGAPVGDYEVLRPDRTVDSRVSLHCFDLSLPGRYTIVARFKDATTDPPSPKGVVRVKDEIDSAPVILTVEPH